MKRNRSLDANSPAGHVVDAVALGCGGPKWLVLTRLATTVISINGGKCRAEDDPQAQA